MSATVTHSGDHSTKRNGPIADGTLITSSVDGTSYLVESGERRLVTNVSALFAAGIADPHQAKRVTLDAGALEAIPVASSLVAGLVGTRQVDSGDQFLGAGHYMHTWGSISSTGQVAMQTRTRTITMFGGYHGAATMITSDAAGAPTWRSQSHRFGVDGTWVGRSDRTDAWWESMSTDAAARTTQAAIFQSWDPDTFEHILDRWVSDAKKIADLIGSVGTVAKVFTTVF